MNARTLIVLTTVISPACFAPDGKLPPSSGNFVSAGAGVQVQYDPGATGGTLAFTISMGGDTLAGSRPRVELSVASSRCRTFARVGLEARPITRSVVAAKGRIRARFKGGYFNGRLDRGAHGATGFMVVGVHGYRAASFWYADEEGGEVLE